MIRKYKDLDEMRLEWFVKNTDLPVSAIAVKFGRSTKAVFKKLYNMGIYVSEIRRGKDGLRHS